MAETQKTKMYSASFGTRDSINKYADICYSEDNDPGNTESLTPLMRAKYYKMHLPEDSIWIDANIEVLDREGLISLLVGKESTFIEHPHHSRLDKEFTVCRERKLDDSRNIGLIESEYRDTTNEPCYIGGIFYCNDGFYYNDRGLFSKWWHLVVNTSKRDQLSLPLVLKMYNKRIIPREELDIYDNKLFKVHRHGRR